MHKILSVCVSLIALRSVTAQWVANTQTLIIKEIEHLYLDSAPSGILSAITPCSNYYDPSTGSSNNNLGMNTAAEWIRTAFRMLLRFHRTLPVWSIYLQSRWSFPFEDVLSSFENSNLPTAAFPSQKKKRGCRVPLSSSKVMRCCR